MSEGWIKYRYKVSYKTENGSGMAVVKAKDEHQARNIFVKQYKMPYKAIGEIIKEGYIDKE